MWTYIEGFVNYYLTREAEAEELAAQLALLLDEEKQEEDAILLDEQLARRLAQEDDEAIAREQQDRELARMLQAKERLKVLHIRSFGHFMMGVNNRVTLWNISREYSLLNHLIFSRHILNALQRVACSWLRMGEKSLRRVNKFYGKENYK